MSSYFLFRGDTLVDRVTDPKALGAGHLHSLGQPGDVLVFASPVSFDRYAWQQPNHEEKIKAWEPLFSTPETEAKYRTLILLQV